MKYEHFLDSDKYSDINPLFIGVEKCEKSHSYGPAIRSYTLVHYVICGKGTFTSRGKSYSVHSGQCFIILPDEVTVYEADAKEPWEYVWVGFTGTFAQRFTKIDIPVINSNSHAFFDIKEAAVSGNFSKLYIASKMLEFMSTVFSDGDNNRTNYPHQVRQYIKFHYTEDIQVEKIAEKFNLNRRYLSRIFKSEYGLSIMQYIVQYRMNKAKEFLSLGYSVSKVAEMTGYADVFNFSKMFKKHFSLSPDSYKKQFKFAETEFRRD